jgi:hypothetical protein
MRIKWRMLNAFFAAVVLMSVTSMLSNMLSITEHELHFFGRIGMC